MSHGGNPEAGTNPFIGIDGTDLKIQSPNGPDSWVIPVTDTFTVSMRWGLSGGFASWLVGLPLTYTVTYTFAGLGNPNGLQHNVTKTTTAGVLSYGAPDTTVTIAAGSLPVGKYEILATVTFATRRCRLTSRCRFWTSTSDHDPGPARHRAGPGSPPGSTQRARAGNLNPGCCPSRCRARAATPGRRPRRPGRP